MTRPRITNIRFAPASPAFIEKGCLGWVCAEYGDLQLDGLRVRRHEDGHLSIGFPQHVDANGNPHAYYRPLDQAARDAIETQVIGELRRRGKIPPASARSPYRTNAPSGGRP